MTNVRIQMMRSCVSMCSITVTRWSVAASLTPGIAVMNDGAHLSGRPLPPQFAIFPPRGHQDFRLISSLNFAGTEKFHARWFPGMPPAYPHDARYRTDPEYEALRFFGS